jgi:hypothetical protein
MQDFLLGSFLLTLILALVLMFAFFEKVGKLSRTLRNESNLLRRHLGNHKLDNLPIDIFNVVIAIHGRCDGNKRLLHRNTKLATAFLGLTTLLLQTPAVLSLTVDIHIVPNELATLYAVAQTVIPILAFNWLIWKFVDSSHSVVYLRDVISQCQLTDNPGKPLSLVRTQARF